MGKKEEKLRKKEKGSEEDIVEAKMRARRFDYRRKTDERVDKKGA